MIPNNFPIPKDLSLLRLRFIFKTEKEFHLRHYSGEMLRSLFGKALAELCCKKYQSSQKIVCLGCSHLAECGYHLLFKPLNPDVTNKRFANIPAPLILSPGFYPPAHFQVGDNFVIDAAIIGDAVSHLPLIVKALRKMGTDGIFDKKTKLSLAQIYNITDRNNLFLLFENSQFLTNSLQMIQITQESTTFEKEFQVTMRFLTPLSLINKNTKVDVITFAIMWQRLIDRVDMIASVYGSGIVNHEDILATKEIAKEIPTISYHIKSRQYHKEKMKENSYSTPVLSGHITFSKIPGAFIPLLKIGEIVHIGSDTAIGFGKYYLKISSENNK